MTQHNNAEHARTNEVIDCYFIEGVHYHKQDLLRARMRFASDATGQVSADSHSANLDAVVESLCSYQFTSADSNSCTSALELHDNQREPYYTFQFVGVLIVHDYVFYVFPKCVQPNYYIDDTSFITPSKESRDFMRLTIDVCEHYRTRTASGTDDTSFSTRSSSNNTNTAELYRALLADYVHNGAYRSRTRIWAYNGNGEIDWGRTLNQVSPYFTAQGAPLYADYWTRDRAVDEEALVRRIQLAWVAYAAQQFESAELLEDVLGFPHTLCSVSQETPTDIGTSHFLRAALSRARNREFSTRNRSLINMLLLLVDSDEQQRLNSQHAITHLGTAPFHTVWEGICRALFSNTDLGVMREQSKPKWHMDETIDGTDIETAAEHNQLIPDVVYTVTDPAGTVIIDAKYYIPEIASGKITGQPGTYDVVKEYFYQLIADIVLHDNGPVVANTFMFPARYSIGNTTLESACVIQGSVRFDALGHYELRHRDDGASDSKGRFLPIICARLNPLSAFQAYADSNASKNFDRDRILNELIQYSEN